MKYLLMAGGVVAAISIFAWLIARHIDTGEKRWLAAIAAYCTLIFAFFMYAVDQRNNKGPCVQHEVQMHYNAATKTTMPAKVCILRGEWIEESER